MKKKIQNLRENEEKNFNKNEKIAKKIKTCEERISKKFPNKDENRGKNQEKVQKISQKN